MFSCRQWTGIVSPGPARSASTTRRQALSAWVSRLTTTAYGPAGAARAAAPQQARSRQPTASTNLGTLTSVLHKERRTGREAHRCHCGPPCTASTPPGRSPGGLTMGCRHVVLRQSQMNKHCKATGGRGPEALGARGKGMQCGDSAEVRVPLHSWGCKADSAGCDDDGNAHNILQTKELSTRSRLAGSVSRGKLTVRSVKQCKASPRPSRPAPVGETLVDARARRYPDFARPAEGHRHALGRQVGRQALDVTAHQYEVGFDAQRLVP